MAKVTVPIDMNSEHKNILGVLSTRQLIYLAVGVLIGYSYIPLVFNFGKAMGGMIAGLTIAGISALPLLIIIIMLAFVPVSKFNMNRDFFYLIKIQSKLDKGSWRKGRYK